MTRMMIATLVMIAAVSGCGGNTSWYFCSGGPEFCSVDRHRDPPDEETDPDQTEEAVTTAALLLAQHTPLAVQSGLESDGLRNLLVSSPDLVGGWLLAGSLAIMVDDGDLVFVTRFLDANRYWLTMTTAVEQKSRLMISGLRLLAEITRERDPLIAAQALSLAGRDSLSDAADAAAGADAAVAAAAKNLVLSRQPADAAAECCAAPDVNAAAVLLCEAPGTDVGGETAGLACQAVRQWFADYLAAQY